MSCFSRFILFDLVILEDTIANYLPPPLPLPPVSEKPWIRERNKWERLSWWATFLLLWVGVAAGAAVCFFGFRNVQKISQPLCSVFEDDFSGGFSTDNWQRDVELGGFG